MNNREIVMSSPEFLDLSRLKARLADLLDRPLTVSELDVLDRRCAGGSAADRLPLIVAWFERRYSVVTAARFIVDELGRNLTREEFALLARKFPDGVPAGMLGDAVALVKRPRPDLRLIK